MYIKSNGNVGIGNHIPVELLDVSGNVFRYGDRYKWQLVSSSSAIWYNIGTWDSSNYQGARFEMIIHAGNGYGSGAVTSQGLTKIYLSTGNQTGGTTTPNMVGYWWSEGGTTIIGGIKIVANGGSGGTCQKWDIYINVNSFAGADNFVEVKWGNNSTFTWSNTSTTDPGAASVNIYIPVNNYCITAGNVGINTTTPTYTLDVSGNLRTTSVITINNTALTNSNEILFTNGTNTYAVQQIDNGGANRFRLGRNGQDDINISSTGQVGINTASTSDFLTIGTSSTTGGLTLNNNTTNYVPASLNYYEEYTALMPWTGPWSSNQTGNITLIRIGKIVNLILYSVSAIASTSATITGVNYLDARFTPTASVSMACKVNDNSVLPINGTVVITNVGEIEVQSSIITTYNGLNNSYTNSFSGGATNNTGWTVAICCSYIV
jgi:hypothetical protein